MVEQQIDCGPWGIINLPLKIKDKQPANSCTVVLVDHEITSADIDRHKHNWLCVYYLPAKTVESVHLQKSFMQGNNQLYTMEWDDIDVDIGRIINFKITRQSLSSQQNKTSIV